jgi:hypothetical protein
MRKALPTASLPCLATIAVLFTGIASAPPAPAQGIQASGGEPKVILGGEGTGIASAPLAPAQGIQTSGGEPKVILGGEFKSTENVGSTEETTKSWSVYTNVGYTSEYNFRGTNLTPDSDGAIFATANLSFSGEFGSLTLGVYGIHQFGTARADAFSISESGGGGTGRNFNIQENEAGGGDNDAVFSGRVSPETIQSEFDEIDVYIIYLYPLGPFDITVGNIGFFINRKAETRVTTTGNLTDEGIKFPFSQTLVIPTVGDEQFDRLFVEISAPRLIPAFHGISVVPRIRYYQTILSEGDDPVAGRLLTLTQGTVNVPGTPGGDPEGPHNIQITAVGQKERNDALGGYLEGRIDAVIPVTSRIKIKPYGIISYSFHDRTEPFDQTQPQPLSHVFHGRTLVGFNHAQFGATVPIELWRGPSHCALTLEPFGAYSYHISDPTAGTDRNEGWGGVQLVFTF